MTPRSFFLFTLLLILLHSASFCFTLKNPFKKMLSTGNFI